MVMLRMAMKWQGFTGAPGYTNFHFLSPSAPAQPDIDAAAVKVRTFFEAVKGLFPNTLTISYPGTMDMFDTGSGLLLEEIAIPVGVATSGSSSATYSASSGACVIWRGTGLFNGRRPIGRTFLVPLTGIAYAQDGTLDAAGLTTIRNAATALATSTSGLDLSIWRRPVNGSGGLGAEVVSSTVNDKVAVLRSRRD